jgi:hypothetical protein
MPLRLRAKRVLFAIILLGAAAWLAWTGLRSGLR